MCIKWEAVGAIGQWFSGIITAVGIFAAIRISKYESNPKVTFTQYEDGKYIMYPDGKMEHIGNIIYRVYNGGPINISIEFMGFRVPHNNFTLPALYKGYFPKTVEVGKDLVIEIKRTELVNAGLKRFDIAYIQLNSHQTYYNKVRLQKRISRSIWWKFGKIKRK